MESPVLFHTQLAILAAGEFYQMNKLRIGLVAVTLGSLAYLLVGCWGQMDSSYATYKTYCGGCHALPDPGQLTKAMWQKVLIQEGARLGIRADGFNPYEQMSENERVLLEEEGFFPEKPVLSEREWEDIFRYVIENAPDSLPADTSRITRSKVLTQFAPHPVVTENFQGSLVTHLHVLPDEKGILGANVHGKLWKWEPGDGVQLLKSFQSPVIFYDRSAEKEYVLEMGEMHPTQLKLGQLWLMDEDDNVRSVIKGLHRPVFVKAEDLNANGKDEILVCEFGYHTGGLSLFTEVGGEYVKTELLPYAGSVRAETHDMNNDGLKDIVLLISQGNEGVYILYQGSDLKFAARQVLRLNPLYGSSDFDLFDYEGDGDMDILMAHGDNADYSPILKSYHGVRLFLNDGNNNFEEVFFYPLYGAFQVEAADFDDDGDIDFAATSFFPDFEHNSKESFVYLENKSSGKFEFEAFTFEGADEGRWLIMESGDMDGDGDIDLVLGSFTYSPAYTPQKYMDGWNETSTDVMYLENNLR